MTVQEMKAAACKAIQDHSEDIIKLATAIELEPELGYKEFKTAAKVQTELDKLGFKHTDGVAITGIITPVEGRDHKAKVAIMGELDAVLVPGCPTADPVTGAAHCCGHNAQAASVVGVAYALKESGIMKELDGDIVLMHVPSEEFVELEYRKGLIDQGKISLVGGKQEFIKLGAMDDIDMMIMQHSSKVVEQDGKTIVACPGGEGGLGFVGRMVQYIGKASHAAMPWEGINALKAAQVGMLAIDSQRETFPPKDNIRVHPIVTKGGDLVNVVPSDVRIETYVRGNNTEGILAAAEKVDRSFQAGADAIGAQVNITRLPGYMCPLDCKPLKELVCQNLCDVFGEEHVDPIGHGGSTDASDVAHIMPTVHMYIGGASGVGHGDDYKISDPQMAIIDAAKVMVCSAIDLLANGAEKALEIKKNWKAPMTKEEYLSKWCGL
ncbi:MAG: M20/M25/M40 family metallo-hydrolase [Firmicutes bacterium]|nr:M20/M25/M40 family metallo-hydrolase [Bacillota bacterium]